MPVTSKPVTVVEIPPLPSAANEIWCEAERSEFIDFIARNPTAGDVIRGSGGVCKVRWSRAGMGKRGGARVIYYYHSEHVAGCPAEEVTENGHPHTENRGPLPET